MLEKVNLNQEKNTREKFRSETLNKTKIFSRTINKEYDKKDDLIDRNTSKSSKVTYL